MPLSFERRYTPMSGLSVNNPYKNQIRFADPLGASGQYSSPQVDNLMLEKAQLWEENQSAKKASQTSGQTQAGTAGTQQDNGMTSLLDELKRMQETAKSDQAVRDSESAAKSEADKQKYTTLADKYMDEWRANLAETKGMYSQAIESIKDPNFGGFGDLEASVKADLDQFKTTFGGLGQEAADLSREQLGIQRNLGNKLVGMTEADYSGVSGRAMQDVAAQSELGRQAEARRLQGLGIDPTSGRYQQMMQKSRMSEALSKAQAGTQARDMEKGRVAGITGMGMQLIDPNKTASLATGIDRQSMDYKNLISGIKSTGVQARNQAAGTVKSIGDSYQNIGSNFSDMSGLYTGLSEQ